MTARARCQCMSTCMAPPLMGLPFCKNHMNKCPRISPSSESDPVYNPLTYNTTKRIRRSHNCFAYAFNHMDIPPESDCNESGCNMPFHQPGRKSGFPTWDSVKGQRCPDILARIMADVPGVTRSTFTQKCPKGSSKIAYVTAPYRDYHFYRKDKGRLWSHKPGASHVTQVDALGHLIYDPKLAARDYSKTDGLLNYSNFCGYVCAPRQKHKFKRGGSSTRKKAKK